jgi:hypothetical protein
MRTHCYPAHKFTIIEKGSVNGIVIFSLGTITLATFSVAIQPVIRMAHERVASGDQSILRHPTAERHHPPALFATIYPAEVRPALVFSACSAPRREQNEAEPRLGWSREEMIAQRRRAEPNQDGGSF